MTNIFKNFLGRLDYKVYPITIIAIFILLIIWPSHIYLPETYGYENSWFENIQLGVLLIGFLWALRAKTDKKLFYFAAMIYVIFFLRGVNCGRIFLDPIPGIPNKFISWDKVKYGYLVHPVFAVYIAFTCGYFLYNKLYLNIIKYLKFSNFPVWYLLLASFGAVGVFYGEAHTLHVLEESCELMVYVCMTGMIHLYGYNQRYINLVKHEN